MKLRPLNKKADLSLSINAIVILILAITMLGLGLAFIRNQFGGATSKLQDVLNQIDANQKADLEKSPDRITFTTDSYSIKRGDSKDVYFAIRNNLGSVSYKFDLTQIQCNAAIDTSVTNDQLNTFVKFQGFANKDVDGGSSAVLPLTIVVSAQATPTVYSCSITVPDPSPAGAGQTYAKKDLYITVTP